MSRLSTFVNNLNQFKEDTSYPVHVRDLRSAKVLKGVGVGLGLCMTESCFQQFSKWRARKKVPIRLKLANRAIRLKLWEVLDE